MSKQEEEPPNTYEPSSYQFFSNNLNYTFYTEQGADVSAPYAVNDAASILSSGSSDYAYQPSSLVIPPSTVSLPAPEQSPLFDLSVEAPAIAENLDTADVKFPASLFAAKVETIIEDKRVEFALNNDDVRRSFDAGLASVPDPDSSLSSVPNPESSLSSVPSPDAEGSSGWHAYVEPNVVPDVFSPEFNFNRSLLKIFWRIDVDHNNRVSKSELALALAENWFTGDERFLAKLLLEAYEDMSPETMFCDAGLSVNNICSYGPFAQMSMETIPYSQPAEASPSRKPIPSTNNKKSSQSLRSLFRGR